MRYFLTNGSNTLSFNPDHGLLFKDTKIGSRKRTANANHYEYTYGDYKKWDLPVSFVNSEFATTINSWWSAGEAISMITTTDVFTVALSNKTKPINDYVEPGNTLYNGMLEFEQVVSEKILIQNYTRRSTPKAFNLLSIASNGDLFVAVGIADGTDGLIVTSIDGLTWTERTNPSNINLNAIVYGNGCFIAVGNSSAGKAYIISSTDGINWDDRSFTTAYNLYALCYGFNKFIAAGQSTGASGPLTIASTDGKAWSVQTPVSVATDVNGLCYSAQLDMYCAVGGANDTDAFIMTTEDGGTTWIERTSPTELLLNAVVYGKGKFVGVGQNAAGADSLIIVSTDAKTWAEKVNPKNDLYLKDVAFISDRFIAVGQDDGTDAYMIDSIDGEIWTEVANPKNVTLYSITHNNHLVVACGSADTTDPFLSTYLITSGLT